MEKKIYELISHIAKDLGFEIVTLQILKFAAIVLQIRIERLDGKPVTISDCALFSRKISLILEEQDPISSKYTLEVSSAGINRPLVKLEDYARFKNNNVVIKLQNPINLEKQETIKVIKGFLLGVEKDQIVIKMANDEMLYIDYNNVSSARLDIKI